MDDFKVLNVLRGKVRERIVSISEAVANGTGKSFDEYRNLCGVITGLALAERDLLDLHNAMEQNDE